MKSTTEFEDGLFATEVTHGSLYNTTGSTTLQVAIILY